ncbi:hypothetical protein BDZ94DRAFT_1269043 [Collybia nuda]|uniref:Uncharacterized protein n=1 Tax=Collybia nuda TaxID=64659 RepID=A0A9P5Y0K4_9AGAR|nr:hypothetical protein BDZ94DRAFT_1269043 [Collybia nuda]
MYSPPQGPLQATDIAALRDGIIVIGCQYVFWGFYAALALGTLYILVSQGLKALSRKFLFTVIIIMFISSTSISIIRILLQLKLIDALGPSPPDDSSLLITWTAVSNCLERLNYVLSDVIVVWRAWIFWARNKYAKILLVLCMLLSTAAAIIDGAFTVVAEVNADGFALPAGASTLILTLPLLITNVFATSLVAYQAWLYRVEVRSTLSRGSAISTVEKLMILLIESGFIYCSLWILVLVTRYRLLSNLAFDVMFAVFPHLTAIYPVFIILLAALERTQSESITSEATGSGGVYIGARFRVGSRQITTQGTETISLHRIEASSTLIENDKQIKGRA